MEMAPIAKVGGMADVVTALARAVREEGQEVEVVVPKYDVLKYDQVCIERVWPGGLVCHCECMCASRHVCTWASA